MEHLLHRLIKHEQIKKVTVAEIGQLHKHKAEGVPLVRVRSCTLLIISRELLQRLYMTISMTIFVVALAFSTCAEVVAPLRQ